MMTKHHVGAIIMADDFQIRLREWKQQGWEITKTGGGHLRLTHDDASMPVFCASTPSDRRAVMNIESNLKKARQIQQIPHQPQIEKAFKKSKKVVGLNSRPRFFMKFVPNVEEPETKKPIPLFERTDKKTRLCVWMRCYLLMRLDGRDLSTIHIIKQRLRKDDNFFEAALIAYQNLGNDRLKYMRSNLINRGKQKYENENQNLTIAHKPLMRRKQKKILERKQRMSI